MGYATERTTHRIYSGTNDDAMQRVARITESIFGDVETGVPQIIGRSQAAKMPRCPVQG